MVCKVSTASIHKAVANPSLANYSTRTTPNFPGSRSPTSFPPKLFNNNNLSSTRPQNRRIPPILRCLNLPYPAAERKRQHDDFSATSIETALSARSSFTMQLLTFLYPSLFSILLLTDSAYGMKKNPKDAILLSNVSYSERNSFPCNPHHAILHLPTTTA